MEGLHRIERNDEPLRPPLEPQSDLEAIIAHDQPAKLELQDDGHFLRICARRQAGTCTPSARVLKAMFRLSVAAACVEVQQGNESHANVIRLTRSRAALNLCERDCDSGHYHRSS